MNVDEYRNARVKFHNNRVITFMTAARTIKKFAEDIEHRYVGPIPEPFYSLVAQLVSEARLENGVVCWFKFVDDLTIEQHMKYNYTGQ